MWQVVSNGDAIATGTGPDITFTPNDNGDYSVELTADDEDGGSAGTSLLVQVSNILTARHFRIDDRSGRVLPVSLVGAAVDPGALDNVALTWSVTENGAVFLLGTGTDLSFTPDDNGLYEVRLTAVDKDGGEGTTTHAVNVANVARRRFSRLPRQVKKGRRFR